MMNNHGDIELRFGYPIYHKDLFNKNESWHNCLGGGKWDIDSEGNVILFGSSEDFGAPKKQDLKKLLRTLLIGITLSGYVSIFMMKYI